MPKDQILFKRMYHILHIYMGVCSDQSVCFGRLAFSTSASIIQVCSEVHLLPLTSEPDHTHSIKNSKSIFSKYDLNVFYPKHYRLA
jgi:hypothetical protein